jgi:hypothetical protein
MEQFLNYLTCIMSFSSIVLLCTIYVLLKEELKRKKDKRIKKEQEKKELLEANKEFIEKNFKDKGPTIGLVSPVALSTLGNNDQGKEISNTKPVTD